MKFICLSLGFILAGCGMTTESYKPWEDNDPEVMGVWDGVYNEQYPDRKKSIGKIRYYKNQFRAFRTSEPHYWDNPNDSNAGDPEYKDKYYEYKDGRGCYAWRVWRGPMGGSYIFRDSFRAYAVVKDVNNKEYFVIIPANVLGTNETKNIFWYLKRDESTLASRDMADWLKAHPTLAKGQNLPEWLKFAEQE